MQPVRRPATIAVIAIQRFGSINLPDLPIPWSQAFLGASGLAAFLILLRLVLTDKVGGSALHLDGSRSYGLYVSMLAALGLVAGCYLKMQEPSGAPEL